MEERTCAWCSIDFAALRADAAYCSKSCSQKAYYRRKVGFPEPWSCNWCGKRFNPMTHKRGRQMRYCSEGCRVNAVRLSSHGTTGAHLRTLFDMQNGQCASCSAVLDFHARRTAPGAFHIDHDHTCCPARGASCGKCIRALLCPPCNWALGALDEDFDRIYGLAQYALRNRNLLKEIV